MEEFKSMTVKELRDALAELPGELPVDASFDAGFGRTGVYGVVPMRIDEEKDRWVRCHISLAEMILLEGD